MARRKSAVAEPNGPDRQPVSFTDYARKRSARASAEELRAPRAVGANARRIAAAASPLTQAELPFIAAAPPPTTVAPTAAATSAATIPPLPLRFTPPATLPLLPERLSQSHTAPTTTAPKPSTQRAKGTSVRARFGELRCLLADGFEIVQPIFARPLWTVADDSTTAFNFVLRRERATRLVTVPEGRTVQRFIRERQLVVDYRR